MPDTTATDATQAHTDLSAADLRDWIVDYVTTEAGDPETLHGRGGWVDKDGVKWAAAKAFGVTGYVGGRGFPQTDRDRLNGRVDRAVKRLADDGALIVATKAHPPPGLPDGPVDAYGDNAGRPRHNNGTLITTPEVLTDAIAAKRTADRRDRDARERAATLARTVATAVGLDQPPRVTVLRDGSVRLELTAAQVAVALGEE
ncbi:hypothetical protein DVS28_b0245 (plasmid) [Euzebya pacifica]|uniref:Uncharacterized protein n=1 Tax=Euzebya pacifica TaxID=1608957 RepID=A0A346Y6B8_9ACTN|nr:hypothetical protein [Euzebya pacifica]AXV10015.1 hypothetical protein DVS28_b0245 [Euzebya pacifica]